MSVIYCHQTIVIKILQHFHPSAHKPYLFVLKKVLIMTHTHGVVFGKCLTINNKFVCLLEVFLLDGYLCSIHCTLFEKYVCRRREETRKGNTFTYTKHVNDSWGSFLRIHGFLIKFYCVNALCVWCKRIFSRTLLLDSYSNHCIANLTYIYSGIWGCH